jgi:hypothetical protein
MLSVYLNSIAVMSAFAQAQRLIFKRLPISRACCVAEGSRLLSLQKWSTLRSV